ENENPNNLNFYFEIDGEKYYESSITIQIPTHKEIVVRAYGGIETCITTDSLIINKKSFEDYLNLSFPNVFTPNKDGLNETFGFVLNNELSGCVDFTIFNRWGKKVYETKATNISWDGIGLNGNECQAGVYVYILNIENYQVLGSVTLLR